MAYAINTVLDILSMPSLSLATLTSDCPIISNTISTPWDSCLAGGPPPKKRSSNQYVHNNKAFKLIPPQLPAGVSIYCSPVREDSLLCAAVFSFATQTAASRNPHLSAQAAERMHLSVML